MGKKKREKEKKIKSNKYTYYCKLHASRFVKNKNKKYVGTNETYTSSFYYIYLHIIRFNDNKSYLFIYFFLYFFSYNV